MRYQNWDVLLFPHGTNVPLAEFRTNCVFVQAGETMGSDPNGRALTLTARSRCPVVVTYVPSLEAGAAFTVSLHSWTPPKLAEKVVLEASGACVNFTAFRVRVVVDGALVSCVKPARVACKQVTDDYSESFHGENDNWPMTVSKCAVL